MENLICRFPFELLEYIFNFFDGATLINASKVCQRWKEITLYISRKPDVWKQIFCEEFDWNMRHQLLGKYCGEFGEDDWEYWRTLCANGFKWRDVSAGFLPNVFLLYEEFVFSCLVRGGCLAVVLRKREYDHIIFDPEMHILQQAWSLVLGDEVPIVTPLNKCMESKCYLYQKKCTLTLCHNRAPRSLILYDAVQMYKVINNTCYILTDNQFLYSCDLSQPQIGTHPYFRAKWDDEIDKIVCMSNREECITFLTENGKILLLSENNIIEDVGKLKLESDTKFTHFECDVAFSVLSDNTMYISTGESDNETAYYYCTLALNSFPTAFRLHCNLLILGLSCGLIYMYHLKSIADVLSLNLLKYSSKVVLGKSPVIYIDVQELDENQKVIVLLENGKLFEIVYD